MMLVDSCWCGHQPLHKKASPHRYGEPGCRRAQADRPYRAPAAVIASALRRPDDCRCASRR